MARPFERIYTPAQYEAVHHAYIERRIRPASRVRQLAEAGELTDRAGEKLPAFTMPERTIRTGAMKVQRKRLGLAKTKLTEMPEPDAKAELKRRLLAIADAGTLAQLERAAKNHGEPDWEQVRLMARAVREINAIPAPKLASTTPAPGQTVDGTRHGERARANTVSGALIRALHDQPSQTEPYHSAEQADTRTQAAETTSQGDGPGSRTSDPSARISPHAA